MKKFLTRALTIVFGPILLFSACDKEPRFELPEPPEEKEFSYLEAAKECDANDDCLGCLSF